MPAASDLNTPYYGGGSAVPDLGFNNKMCELFRFPSTVISSRKFDPVTGIPLWPLVWLISELFTAPFALVSPNRTFMGTVTLPSPFTLSSVIMSRFWLDTLCKFTVTVLPATIGGSAVAMLSVLVTVAPVTVTGAAKVITTVKSLPLGVPRRHSIAGAGGSRLTSKSPAAPCVLRETALTGTGGVVCSRQVVKTGFAF